MNLAKLKGKEKTAAIVFAVSLLCMVVFAVSFLLMPIANGISLNEGKNGMLYAVGIQFWVSLLVSLILTLAVSLMRKKYAGQDMTFKKLPGIVTFFSNRESKVADILTVVFLIAFIICTFVTDSYLIYVFIFLTVLSFEAHCVLNGKNYTYMKELISGGKAR